MPTGTVRVLSDPTVATLRWQLLGVGPSVPRDTNWLVRLQTELDGDLRITWSASFSEALQSLRETVYSGIVIGDMPFAPTAVAHPAEEFVRALRATGDGTPVVVLLPLPHDEQVATLLQWGCEVSVTPRLWDSPALPRMIATSIQRAHERRELEHLRAVHQRRLAREQTDAATLMQLQQQSLHRLVAEPDEPLTTGTRPTVTAEVAAYAALLRNYLVSPAESLAAEIAGMVEALRRASFGPQAVRNLHVAQLDELLAGLGGRASRQVLARANLLALDVITQLGERYADQPDGDTGGKGPLRRCCQ